MQLRGGRLWGLAGAIARLGRARQWAEALGLLQSSEDLAKSSDKAYSPDAAAYNAGIKVMGTLSRWRQGLTALARMQQRLTRPNVITLGSVLNGLLQGGSLNVSKAWLRVVHLFADAKSSRLGTGVVLLNTVLASFSDDGQWQLSMQSLQEAARRCMETDVISWNSAVAASHKSWTRGLLCLSALQMSALSCDAVSHNSAIQGCAGALQWEQILDASHYDVWPS